MLLRWVVLSLRRIRALLLVIRAGRWLLAIAHLRALLVVRLLLIIGTLRRRAALGWVVSLLGSAGGRSAVGGRLIVLLRHGD